MSVLNSRCWSNSPWLPWQWKPKWQVALTEYCHVKELLFRHQYQHVSCQCVLLWFRVQCSLLLLQLLRKRSINKDAFYWYTLVVMAQLQWQHTATAGQTWAAWRQWVNAAGSQQNWPCRQACFGRANMLILTKTEIGKTSSRAKDCTVALKGRIRWFNQRDLLRSYVDEVQICTETVILKW